MGSAFAFRGVIDYRDGWMCLKTIEPMFNEPKLVTQWWPIERTAAGEQEVLDLAGNEGCMSGGRVSFRMGKSPNAAWAQDRNLPQSGRTVAIATETTDYPCPKVRTGIETRYRQGRWEKYLKSAGWVAA